METISTLFHNSNTPQILVQAGVIFLFFRFLFCLGLMFGLMALHFHLKHSPERGRKYNPIGNSLVRNASLNHGGFIEDRKQRVYTIPHEYPQLTQWDDRVSPNAATDIIFNKFFTRKSKHFLANKV